jgi:hypothetical protein
MAEPTIHLAAPAGGITNACRQPGKMRTSNPHDVTCVDCASTWDYAWALRRAGERVKGASSG